MLHAIYCGDWDRASRELKDYRKIRQRSPMKQLQLLRIMHHYFSALVALHKIRAGQQFSHTSSRAMTRIATKFIRRLQNEQLEYTSVVASMLCGLLKALNGNADEAREQFADVRRRAASLELIPIQLAAEDATEQLDNQQLDVSCGCSLQVLMRQQGVIRPDQFEQLYTVRID